MTTSFAGFYKLMPQRSLHMQEDALRKAGCEKFFEQSVNTTGLIPEQITTDKEPAL